MNDNTIIESISGVFFRNSLGIFQALISENSVKIHESSSQAGLNDSSIYLNSTTFRYADTALLPITVSAFMSDAEASPPALSVRPGIVNQVRQNAPSPCTEGFYMSKDG
jgi:hypothetical protein